MSDYTIVNLGDVENVAPKFQMPEGMDVRFPKRELGCSVGGVGIEKLPPGVRQPFGHTHSRQEEVYVIDEGSGGITLIAFGAPIAEENDGEIVPGWWADGDG